MDLEAEQSKDRRIVSLEHEVEILQEQLESLKQELLEERQRADDYLEELTYTQLELEELDRELLNFTNLEMLQEAQAVKIDPSLKEQELSSSPLDWPFNLHGLEGKRVNKKENTKELMLKIESERSRLRKQIRQLSHRFSTFKNSSDEFIQQIKVFKPENSGTS
ncbi:hypothetical protein [Microcoleus sp. FACHB-672]|uniref:hypothetical protein n=1 Tax=Microcoleus sp. FACHB-672 TaxID=2692825 RepID=UPI001685CAA5|nr:hypothetical protein [Microcoleus sp. FACHB-672]MBD2040414.1 hypothetical protein [Microcoleus sp. FACHB-672]